MSRYTAEQREAIMATARRNLGRRVKQPPTPADVLAGEKKRPPVEDALTRWKREADEFAQQVGAENDAREARPLERRIDALETELASVHALRAEIETSLRAEIETSREFALAVVAEALGETLLDQREERDKAVHELRTELAVLAAKIAEQKVEICELRIEIADRGKIVDLPALPSLRRVN